MIFVNRTRLNTRRVLAAGVAVLLLSATTGFTIGYFGADDSSEVAALKARIAALETPQSLDIASFRVTDRIPFSQEDLKLEFEDRGYLGVTGDRELDPELNGVPIEAVIPGTAAEAAGLQVGDIILSIDGLKTEEFEELRLEIQCRQPGDPALFQLSRGGVLSDHLIKLGSWNAAHD